MDEKGAFRHLEYLVRECGPRPATSDAAHKAGDYIAGILRGAVDSVELHEFELPRCELVDSQLESATAGGWQAIEHKPCWFAGDTGDKFVAAPLAFAGDGSEAFLRAINPAGKVLLIARDSYIDYPDDVLLRRLVRYRPAAVLFTTSAGWVGEPPDVYYNFETVREVPAPPSAVIGYFDAVKLLEENPTELRFRARYRNSPASCRNVVGHLRGSGGAGETVVVCAHYDTVPGSPGATDDGGGIALVLTLAEIMGHSARGGGRLARDVLFACWSGHEPGLFGSNRYLRDHPDVLRKTRLALNIDTIGHRLHLDRLHYCAGPQVEERLAQLVGELGYEWGMSRGSGGGDMFNFSATEIPAMTLTQGLTAWLHTSRDSLETCTVDAFHAPLAFARSLLEWAGSDAQIVQGYPPDLKNESVAYGHRFGWGVQA